MPARRSGPVTRNKERKCPHCVEVGKVFLCVNPHCTNYTLLECEAGDPLSQLLQTLAQFDGQMKLSPADREDLPQLQLLRANFPCAKDDNWCRKELGDTGWVCSLARGHTHDTRGVHVGWRDDGTAVVCLLPFNVKEKEGEESEQAQA